MPEAPARTSHPARSGPPGADPAQIEAAIDAALDEAGIAGLCEDGQIEAAVGRVAARWPALDRDALIEAVTTSAADRARSLRS